MATPKLRFKEFEGDLTESKLVELTLWASGGTPAKDIPEYWGDDIPLISGASMHTSQLYESDVKITRLGLQKGSKLAPKDSILILVRGSMLFNKIPMGITLGDVAFNQDVKCIRPKQELAPLFLFQWLHAKENTIQNKVTATGIGAGKLDTADLQNLKLYKPSSEEQTKIASFLSAVDEKISQLKQKHALLNQYKQGMMQKLFSQQIRFKADDGSEFGEWKETRVKDIFDVTRGQVLAVSKTVVVADKEYKFPVFSSQTKQNGLMGFYKEYLFEDAITWTTDGANAGEVNFRKGKFYCTNVCGVLKSEKGYANYCIAEILNRVTRKYVSYVGNPKLMNNVMSEIPITIPRDIKEQTKIANFLSSIDQKIEVVAQQIEQAKQWKKGLLQQMFV
ncbi:restriction endonuclease subunit S [Acinetobacter johnsonii]|nr:restriction endonuclease subunit S [Acinetobacter johnsonii]MCF7643222.1 restriction endonuclease subunit S [Acinetobacter johnsonii]